MRTFPIKVHYKVIEMLAVRWLGTKLMQIFKETTSYKRRKLAGRSLKNDDEVNICFPHILNIVLEGWLASFPGPRPASRRLQYCKRREAGRGPWNEAKGW